MNSQFLYADALRSALRRTTAWLDLGCGHQFLPEWMPETRQQLNIDGCRVVGIDLDAPALSAHPHLRMRIIGSVEHLPLGNGTFDLITANMVIEHVEHPEALFQEVGRVLKPGGLFLVHTPNVLGYTTRLTRLVPEDLRPRVAHLLQGRLAHDVYPTFYRANTVSALEHTARRSNLMPVNIRTVESSPQLYRVPVLRSLESGLLRVLQADALARWRPCIIGQFERAAGPAR